MPLKRTVGALSTVLLISGLAACGGDDAGGGGGENSAFEENLDSRGPITYVQGKDNSGVAQPLVDKWNEEHPDEKVTLKEQTDEADQQHDDLVRNFDAQNADYDVVSVDVIWTAEFAAKGYLQPLEGDLAIDTEGLLEPTVEQGTTAASSTPRRASDGGMLYYRSDLVEDAAGHLGRDDGDVLHRRQGEHGLLRRAVPEVRGHDRQRL